MTRRFLIPYCGIMLALNAFSCDVLLPAFFAMQAEFGGSIAAIQAVVPIYLMAAATGQIVFGPASDRFGRRPVLFVGLGFYLVGCLLAFAASTLPTLYAARGLQGFGASCIVVLGRAILRDTHSGPDLARTLALAMAIFSLGPVCAPLFGIGVMAFGSWRLAFVGLSAIGLGLLIATQLAYRETNRSPDPEALRPAVLLGAARRVVTHPQSRHFLAVMTGLQITIVVLLASAPRIFRSAFGIESTGFAMLFALAALGIPLGQLINNHLLARIGVVAVTRRAAVFLLASVVSMAVLARTPLMNPALFTLLLFLFNLAFLVVLANSVGLVLDPHRTIAGTASALLGFITQLGGSALALAILPWLDGTIGSWSVVHLAIVAVVVTGVLLFVPSTKVESA